MYSPIHEPITACISCAPGAITLISFKWGTHEYKNLRTALVYQERRGRTMVTYCCVDDGVNFFKLSCNGDTLGWQLEEIATA